jgi:hypothetical protein
MKEGSKNEGKNGRTKRRKKRRRKNEGRIKTRDKKADEKEKDINKEGRAVRRKKIKLQLDSRHISACGRYLSSVSTSTSGG